MKYEELVRKILLGMGGRDNIISYYHCGTRLRFQVAEPAQIDKEAIKNIQGVLSLVEASGQYQVVIGTHVADVFKEVEKQMKKGSDIKDTTKEMKSANEMKAEVKNKKVTSSFLDVISGVFTPVLGMLSATGVLKGLLALLTALQIMDTSGGTYIILNACADCFLYALPVFLGYTSMKKFGGTPFIGMGIGFALIYPAVIAAMSAAEPLYTLFKGTIFESPVYIEFLGCPVILMNYSSSVIPIIATTFFASKIERFFDKRTSDLIKSFFVPMMTLLISVPLAFLVIGPIATWTSNLLGEGALALYKLSPLVYGFIYGAFIQVFVMLGLHWGFIAICLNNVATLGFDPITIAGLASPLAQGAVVLMIWILTKNKALKGRCGASFFPTLVGCSEPAIYGVNLQYKKAFAVACAASGLGGAIIGAAGVKQYLFGTGGVLGFLQVINPSGGFDSTVTASIVACLVSFISACIMVKVIGLKRLGVEQ